MKITIECLKFLKNAEYHVNSVNSENTDFQGEFLDNKIDFFANFYLKLFCLEGTEGIFVVT